MYQQLLDNTYLAVILLAVGLFLIIKGGDWFVDSSIWLAKITKIPSIVIGATIVSIGTTLPECFVSVIAAIKGVTAGDPTIAEGLNSIAVSNSVGSILCNTALILALVLMIRPPKTEGRSFDEKAIFLVVICVMLALFSINGILDLWEAIILLVCFVAFIALNIFDAKRQQKLLGEMSESDEKEYAEAKAKNKWKMLFLFLLGAVSIALGAKFLVDTGESLALKMGIDPQIIGITIIAIGTSLPELVTSITALRKKDASIGLGNIIGADIINATFILGTVAAISGTGLALDFITRNVSLFVMLAIVLVLAVPSIIKKKTYRWQGVAMMAMYLAFMVFNIVYVAAAE